jgi:hypothetical protein
VLPIYFRCKFRGEVFFIDADLERIEIAGIVNGDRFVRLEGPFWALGIRGLFGLMLTRPSLIKWV